MWKMTLALTLALYAGFVIWGEPSDLGEAEASVALSATPVAPSTDSATYDRPVILVAESEVAMVTRDAVAFTPSLDPAAIAAAAPVPAVAEPRVLGEPIIVSLVQPGAPAETQAALAVETEADAATGGALLSVTGSRVNMRTGPSTTQGVVDSLPRGTVTEAIGAPQNGWQRIRDLSTGRTGWMSARFLAPA
jgi:hypothetical protein